MDGIRIEQDDLTRSQVLFGAEAAVRGARRDQVDAHHGRGVASSLLEHLIAEAVRRAYTRLSLETGTQPFFEPARRLYTRYGFTSCPPFADYRPDPNSTFMTRRLTPPPG
ncbi:MAG: GNAT family N-acetyltransferase [Kribbellaceae bacterium]